MTRIAPPPAAAPTRLNVHVIPGARRSGLVGRHGEAWKVRVAAPPERGRANDAVAVLLADVVGIPRRDVRVIAGATRRDKIVELIGVTLADAQERLIRESEGPAHER